MSRFMRVLPVLGLLIVLPSTVGAVGRAGATGTQTSRIGTGATPSAIVPRSGNDGYAAVGSGCWSPTAGFFLIDLIDLSVGEYSSVLTFTGPTSDSVASDFTISSANENWYTTSLDSIPTGTYTVSLTWTGPAGAHGSYGPSAVTISGCILTSVPAPGSPLTAPIIGMATTVNDNGNGGYWMAGADGSVRDFGNVISYFGEMAPSTLKAPIVAMVAPPNEGVLLVDKDGRVFTFVTPGFYGSTENLALNQPIVGIAPTPDGKGYWLVAADGGVFAFGDAGFYGSMAGTNLYQPVVGVAATRDGKGYYLVARDGGIFAFGDARYQGSMGGKPLNEPVVGMSLDPRTGGYWEVAADGGIFSFGAPFFGSTGGLSLDAPVVAINSMPDGGGYRFVASDGGVFDFGDAAYLGSPVTTGG